MHFAPSSTLLWLLLMSSSPALAQPWIPKYHPAMRNGVTGSGYAYPTGGFGPGPVVPYVSGSRVFEPTGTRLPYRPRPTGDGPEISHHHSTTSKSISLSCPSGTVSTPAVPQSTAYVGFGRSLDYDFVINTTAAQTEIFKYLPVAIANGLSLCSSDITMQALWPLDTSKSLDFITTIAQFSLPARSMDDFLHGICNRNTIMYHDAANTSATIIIDQVNQDILYSGNVDIKTNMMPSSPCARLNGSAPIDRLIEPIPLHPG